MFVEKVFISCAVALLVVAIIFVGIFLTFRDFFFDDDYESADINEVREDTSADSYTPADAGSSPDTAVAPEINTELVQSLEGGWYQISGDIILFFLNTVEIIFTVTGENNGIIYTDNDEADWYIDADGVLKIRDKLDFRLEINDGILTLTDIEGDSRVYKRTPESGRPMYSLRVGSDLHGYVTIPDTWTEFIDPDAAPGMIQYTDNYGAVITLEYFDPGMHVEAYGTIQNLAADMRRKGARDIEAATVLLNGETAYRLNARYIYTITTEITVENSEDNEDSEENEVEAEIEVEVIEYSIFVIIWMFGNPDGSANYICAEGPEESIEDVYLMVEETYSFEEFE